MLCLTSSSPAAAPLPVSLKFIELVPSKKNHVTQKLKTQDSDPNQNPCSSRVYIALNFPHLTLFITALQLPCHNVVKWRMVDSCDVSQELSQITVTLSSIIITVRWLSLKQFIKSRGFPAQPATISTLYYVIYIRMYLYK